MTQRIVLLLLLFHGSWALAQLNYLDFKEQFPLTCTNFDSASVIASQKLLDSLDQYEVVEGRDRFLHDIGMTYYFRYGKWKNKEDLKKSLYYFQQGYNEFKGSSFAWECCFLNQLDGNCEKSLEYAGIYEKLRKEEGYEVDYEQLYRVLKKCCN